MQAIEKIDEKLNAAATHLMQLRSGYGWPSERFLDQAVTQSIHFLDDHLHALRKNAVCLFDVSNAPQNVVLDVEALFSAWHMDKNPPSLVSMCMFLCEKLAISPDPDDLNMVMVSAILGQVHNDQKYHNDMHFRKVLAQTMRLIVANNAIYEGTSRALDTKQICRLISAACIHDLDHDGQGNFVKGVHIEGRAEKHSFNIAEPYLRAAGCDDETLHALRVMLLTTDVSPLDDPANPMMQMKAAYRFHFLGGSKETHSLNLSKDIRALEKDPMLTTSCMFLHEADIATSAAMTYNVTQFETSLIMEEFKDDKAYPSDVVNFLDQICQRSFLTDAGQKLYSANMARIYALAEADEKNGNEAYPPSHLAAFALPKHPQSRGLDLH